MSDIDLQRVRPHRGRSRPIATSSVISHGHAIPEDTMARVGRLLVTAAILGSGPVFAWADLSRTHSFNPRWTPHARFHDASAVVTELGWSITSLWLLWRRGTRDQGELALKIASLHPVLAYAPFLIPEAVPGAESEDEPGKLPRVAGVPGNLFGAGVVSGLSALGYLLGRGEDRLSR
jgi:hypothetical protein